ncbi:antitoxin [Sphaerotilus sp.]|jgi:antitoxin VapB|uniref:antitoxin n=1 Tax=Sphaerotilus sp. TaxID=2093942 RepID=UPI0025E039E9|nr:AbrB/MazE/SpoVT family DNA-binding domain-containing protein [Sphaerotilus sp.]
MDTAKLFWSGRSQAVRLPKDFRIEGTEVRIRRHGVALILEPMTTDWAWLDALAQAGPLDADAIQAIDAQRLAQDRPELDALFD